MQYEGGTTKNYKLNKGRNTMVKKKNEITNKSSKRYTEN